jgi:hypothetical protein
LLLAIGCFGINKQFLLTKAIVCRSTQARINKKRDKNGLFFQTTIRQICLHIFNVQFNPYLLILPIMSSSESSCAGAEEQAGMKPYVL